MKQISVRVDDELLAAIEAARGEVPREQWMRAALASTAEGEIHAHHPAREDANPWPRLDFGTSKETKAEMDAARQAKLNKSKGL